MLPRGYIEQPRPKPEPHLGSWFSRGTARQLNGLGTLPLRWILTHQKTTTAQPTGRPYSLEWTPHNPGQGLREQS